MFDLGWQEFMIIAFVLLIVVGPKDLPKVLRSVTSFVSKLKSMASDFHRGIDDLANETEISDLRNEMSTAKKNKMISSEIEELKNINNIDMDFIKEDIKDIQNLSSAELKANNKQKNTKV